MLFFWFKHIQHIKCAYDMYMGDSTTIYIYVYIIGFDSIFYQLTHFVDHGATPSCFVFLMNSLELRLLPSYSCIISMAQISTKYTSCISSPGRTGVI